MFCPKCGRDLGESSQCPDCDAGQGPQPGPAKRTSGLAIVSLILGIVPVIPIIGSLLAIIFGVSAKKRIRKDPSLGGDGLSIAGIILGAVQIAFFLLLCAMLLPALSRAREQARRSVCVSNLKQAGLAMMMYTQDYGEHFPENLSQLVPTYLFSQKTLICPSRIPPVSVEEVKGNPEICYEYVPETTTAFSVDCLLLYDREENHNREGRNALFHDGRVQWVSIESWPSVWDTHVREYEAGKAALREGFVEQ